MGKERTEDPSMRKVQKVFKSSGMTLQELGDKMGYQPASARQAVAQFLKSGDPQVSMLRRFAKAVGGCGREPALTPKTAAGSPKSTIFRALFSAYFR